MFFTKEDFLKIEEYLKLNSKKDTDFLEFTGLLDENDIIAIVHNGQSCKTSLLLLASTIADKVVELVTPNFINMQEQLDSLVIGGLALKQLFGNEKAYGISLKVLTAAFNEIWGKLEDLTGEVLQGINMIVTPTYFIGEQGANVHISASTADTNGIFEHIAFYANGNLIVEDDNIDYLEYDTNIEETSVIKCVAKILGIEYIREQVVTHYNSFWLGAGNSYMDVINAGDRCLIPITNGMRGAYDITVEEGLNIIVIVGKSLRERFIRADLNGAEIPFNEIKLDENFNETLNDNATKYIAFISAPWSAGTYNIDING